MDLLKFEISHYNCLVLGVARTEKMVTVMRKKRWKTFIARTKYRIHQNSFISPFSFNLIFLSHYVLFRGKGVAYFTFMMCTVLQKL